LEAKAYEEKRVILFNLSGHGNFDMSAYQSYLSGELQDYAYPEEEIRRAMEKLPQAA
jgi:tryptophan synthase beta chain